MQNIKVIAFDADDTLWENQPHFNLIINNFVKLLNPYCAEQTALKAIHSMQVKNLSLYGFGARSLTLSMIQVACKLSNGHIDAIVVEKILDLGKTLLTMPVDLFDSAQDVVKKLKLKYRLILLTKGDLIEQERKLRDSGLIKYFHHIEIISDKKAENYQRLFERLNIKPEEFIMVGNSLKSDILPVLKLKAKAVYIPYHSTWEHENVTDYDHEHKNLTQIEKLSDLLPLLA